MYKHAASGNQQFHVVEGANHMSLYDVPKFVDEAVSVLAPFFKANLDLIAKVELAGMAR